MARYQLGKTEIVRKEHHTSFDARALSSIAQGIMFLEEPYHFIKIPEIHNKLVLSPYQNDSLDFWENKDFTSDQKLAANIPDEEIIDLGNLLLPESVTDKPVINVFLRDSNVIIINGKLIDPEAHAEKIEASLDFLVARSTNAGKIGMDQFLILKDNDEIRHIAQTGIAKAFIPFMGDWFEGKFPGLVVGDDADNAKPVTEQGFKLLLSMFGNDKHAIINLEKETLPREAYFSVNIQELAKNDLSNGLTTKQLKPFINFLKNEKKDLKVTHTAGGFFAGKNVLTKVDKDSYEGYETVTWPVFVKYRDRFPLGCCISFAPGQVILDKNDREVFSYDEVHEVYYKGPTSISPVTRNSIEVIVKGKEIPTGLSMKLGKFFKEEFGIPVLSIHVIKNLERGVGI